MLTVNTHAMCSQSTSILKDHDFELLYYPGKANTTLMVIKFELIENLRDMNLGFQLEPGRIICIHLVIINNFLEKMKVK